MGRFYQQIKKFISIDNVQSIEHLGLYICSAHHTIYGIFNRTIRLALKGLVKTVFQIK